MVRASVVSAAPPRPVRPVWLYWSVLERAGDVSLAVGCKVSLALKRGLTSVRSVRGPSGSCRIE